MAISKINGQTLQAPNLLTIVGATALVATATPTTIFSMADAGHYIVAIWILGTTTQVYGAVANLISDGAGNYSIQHIVYGNGNNNYADITLSGANVQAQQKSGSSYAIQYRVLKIN